jgi:hypothetical protein
LNWIGHWYQPSGALSAESIAAEFAIRLTEGLAAKTARTAAEKPLRKSKKASGGKR